RGDRSNQGTAPRFRPGLQPDQGLTDRIRRRSGPEASGAPRYTSAVPLEVKMHRPLVLLLAFSVLSGCATTSTEVLRIGDQQFDPRPDDHTILVYTHPSQIEREYLHIAQLEFTRTSGRDGLFWKALSPMSEEDRLDALKD